MVPNTATLDKMTVFWNRVLRWVTNCFYSTQVTILPCKACLPPLNSLLSHKRKMAAFRMACSSPCINPAAARMPLSFPGHSDHTASDSLRSLTVGLKQNYIPLRWDQHKPTPAVRSHLPIDNLCHLLWPLTKFAKTFPLLYPHLLPADQDPPPRPHPGRTYSALKSLLNGHLIKDWELQSPPPTSYPYQPTLVPHAFMGLDRFTAGRIHQMRAGKSYLAAHPDWGDPNPNKTCPVCKQGEETFEHATLYCTAKVRHRARHLPDLHSVGPESPLWTSKDFVLGLARYINASNIGFPPSMFTD